MKKITFLLVIFSVAFTSLIILFSPAAMVLATGGGSSGDTSASATSSSSGISNAIAAAVQAVVSGVNTVVSAINNAYGQAVGYVSVTTVPAGSPSTHTQ